jgi:hypothetical protein
MAVWPLDNNASVALYIADRAEDCTVAEAKVGLYTILFTFNYGHSAQCTLSKCVLRKQRSFFHRIARPLSASSALRNEPDNMQASARMPRQHQ